MFNLCSSVKVKEEEKQIKYKPTQKYKKPQYRVEKCNDVELSKLFYKGTVNITYGEIVNFFGLPQRIKCYKGPFAYELLWYIKFNDRSIASISKYFKIIDYPKYNTHWRICTNRKKALENLISLNI